MQRSNGVNGHAPLLTNDINNGDGNSNKCVVTKESKFFVADGIYQRDPYGTGHHALTPENAISIHQEATLVRHRNQAAYDQQQHFPQIQAETYVPSPHNNGGQQYFYPQTHQHPVSTELNRRHGRQNEPLSNFENSLHDSRITECQLRGLAVKAMKTHNGDTAISMLQKLENAGVKLDTGTINSAIASCRRTTQFYHVHIINDMINRHITQVESSGDKKFINEWNAFCAFAQQNGHQLA